MRLLLITVECDEIYRTQSIIALSFSLQMIFLSCLYLLQYAWLKFDRFITMNNNLTSIDTKRKTLNLELRVIETNRHIV